MTVENVSMCGALCLILLMIVVQLRMKLPMIEHVLIHISELKQQLVQPTIVLSHVPKMQKFANLTLTRTITTTAKIIISLRCLDTML